MRLRIWGPWAPLGLALAGLAFAGDQLHKLWMFQVVDIEAHRPVQLTSFLNLTLVWNKGVSYGLLPTYSQGILIGVSLIVSCAMWVWLCQSSRPLTVAALGLLIGGALANAFDRLIHGAVADFFHLHWNGWNWYVFNLADVAIVAGVALLLYESFLERGQANGLGNA